MIPQPIFIENGTDPGNFGEVWVTGGFRQRNQAATLRTTSFSHLHSPPAVPSASAAMPPEVLAWLTR